MDEAIRTMTEPIEKSVAYLYSSGRDMEKYEYTITSRMFLYAENCGEKQ